MKPVTARAEPSRLAACPYGLPWRDFRAYLDCGILACGFARVRCPDCGFERLVAFSCKAHLCPSCNARRKEDTADHLVCNVLPPVPVRQWVLSMPRRVRFWRPATPPPPPACSTSSPGRPPAE